MSRSALLQRLARLAPTAVALGLSACVSTAPLELRPENPASPRAASGAVDMPSALADYKSAENFAASTVENARPGQGGHGGHAGMAMSADGAGGSGQSMPNMSHGTMVGMSHDGMSGMSHGGMPGMHHEEAPESTGQ